MKLTQKRRAILERLKDGEDHQLTGAECVSARGLKASGLVLYRGMNYFRITPAGRSALATEGKE